MQKSFQIIGTLAVTIILTFTTSIYAKSASISAKGSLYPMGSFEAKSTNVIGKGYRQGNKYFAKSLKAPINNFSTDNNMRDDHMKEKLKSDKHPFIIVENIKAENGKGTAMLTFVGVKKPITFTFKDLDGKSAEAKFDINLPDYKIEGISYKGVGVEDKLSVVVTLPYEKKK